MCWGQFFPCWSRTAEQWDWGLKMGGKQAVEAHSLFASKTLALAHNI